MNYFKLIILIFSIVINEGFTQEDEKNLILPPRVKTQSDLARYQAKRYIAKFPFHAFECGLHYLEATNYHRLIRHHGPEAFQQAFRLNSLKREPATENQFAFDNNAVGDVCSRDFGYCHGHTTSLTLWNRLAHFDPQNINKAIYPKDIGSDEWFDYYRAIIDKLMHKREPIVLPGFHHLYEFSDSHPRITRYLKEHVALEWAERNINISSYFKVLKSIHKKFTIEKALKLHQKLSFLINTLNFNPVIWIASSSGRDKRLFEIENEAGIHNMQAYAVTPIDAKGDYKVYFWDIYAEHDVESDLGKRSYTISTKIADANGLAQVVNNNHNIQKINFKHGLTEDDENTIHYDFADMDTVPFDMINIGDDAYKLLKFYKNNPEFTEYLEKKLEYDKKHKPKPFRAPYRGTDKSPFEILLSDGSIWKVPAKYQYFTGDLYIESYQVDEIPEKVKKTLDILTNKKWRDGEKIERYSFQKARPFEYLDSNNTKQKFEFNIKWFDFDGKFYPDSDFYQYAPKELIAELKHYTLNWPLKKAVNLKYLSNPESNFRNFKDDNNNLMWKVPIEFMVDRKFHIPKGLESKVPYKVVTYLKQHKLWPLYGQYYLNILPASQRTITYLDNKKFIIPVDWFSSSRIIKMNDERFQMLPDLLKIVFAGFKNKNFDGEKEFHISRFSHSPLMVDNKQYYLPYTWYNDEGMYNDDDGSEGQVIMMFDIPREEIPYITNDYKKIIVGKNGTWPPKRLELPNSSMSVELSDGSKYYWPLSWISSGFNLDIPKGEERLVPKNVIDEIFGSGPYGWPINYSLFVYNIQLYPQILKDGTRWHWPRAWMEKEYGNIKLPKSEKELARLLPLEIQEKIKKAYNGSYPRDRRVNVWNLNFE